MACRAGDWIGLEMLQDLGALRAGGKGRIVPSPVSNNRQGEVPNGTVAEPVEPWKRKRQRARR